MTNDDRPMKDKSPAQLDTIIAKRVPGDALSRQALDEKHRRQEERDTANQSTQRKLLSRTTVILWVTIIGVLLTLAALVVALFK